MERVVLASDFHLRPDDPAGIEVFARFCREVVAGADRFYVLGDLFNFWVGRKNLLLPGLPPAFDALRGLADGGTDVIAFHGNRDFLLDEAFGERIGGRVVGEELEQELFGRRYLLLHGDSLCTNDVGYQRSKVWLRCGILHALSRVLPLWACLRIARALRSTSRRTTARKEPSVMDFTAAAVAARFAEGFDALICGHIHRPGVREYRVNAGARPVYVMSDWHEGGVYCEVDARGARLERFG